MRNLDKKQILCYNYYAKKYGGVLCLIEKQFVN